MGRKEKKINDISKGHTDREDSGIDPQTGSARASARCTTCWLWYNPENESQNDYHAHQ